MTRSNLDERFRVTVVLVTSMACAPSSSSSSLALCAVASMADVSGSSIDAIVLTAFVVLSAFSAVLSLSKLFPEQTCD